MNFYYVKSGGTATGNVSFATKQTGAWFVASSDYYDNLVTCIDNATFSDGDVICVSNTHYHEYAATIYYDIPESITIISVDNANKESELVGAQEKSLDRMYFSSLGAQNLSVYSMKFTSVSYMYIHDPYLKFRSKTSFLEVLGDNRIQPQAGSYLEFISTEVIRSPYLSLYGGCNVILDDLRWSDYTPDFLIYATTQAGHVLIKNTDFTAIVPPTSPIFRAISSYTLVVRDCKININQEWLYATPSAGATLDVYSCDNGSGYHYFYHWRYEGQVEESTITHLNYSYDDTNKASALMNSSAYANLGSPLKHKLCEIPAQNLSGGVTTYRVNLLLDTDTVATLSDNEFWIELTHPDNTTQALGVTISTRNTDILATGTELTSSAETWGGTLPTNNKAYQVDITVPQLTNVTNGSVVVYVNLAVANADVYVDPAVQIEA